MTLPSVRDDALATLANLGVDLKALEGGDIPARSPVDGSVLATLRAHTVDEANAAVEAAHQAFLAWRKVPAPRRGELIRLFGEELRPAKAESGEGKPATSNSVGYTSTSSTISSLITAAAAPAPAAADE